MKAAAQKVNFLHCMLHFKATKGYPVKIKELNSNDNPIFGYLSSLGFCRLTLEPFVVSSHDLASAEHPLDACPNSRKSSTSCKPPSKRRPITYAEALLRKEQPQLDEDEEVIYCPACNKNQIMHSGSGIVSLLSHGGRLGIWPSCDLLSDISKEYESQAEYQKFISNSREFTTGTTAPPNYDSHTQ